jgi:hypothetical protein
MAGPSGHTGGAMTETGVWQEEWSSTGTIWRWSAHNAELGITTWGRTLAELRACARRLEDKPTAAVLAQLTTPPSGRVVGEWPVLQLESESGFPDAYTGLAVTSESPVCKLDPTGHVPGYIDPAWSRPIDWSDYGYFSGRLQ